MIAITGGTGQLGQKVALYLSQFAPQIPFIVGSSTKEGVSQLEAAGYRSRRMNFDQPDSLQASLVGIKRLLVISTMSPNRYEQHRNIIDAAAAAGVESILYTGLAIRSIEESAVKELMESHFQTEAYMQQSGLIYQIVRNTMYAEAIPQLLGTEQLFDDIKLPAGDGEVPFVLRREMAEGLARLLLNDAKQSEIISFVGNKPLTFVDIAQGLQLFTGKKIKYNPESQESYVMKLQQRFDSTFPVYLHAGTLTDIRNHQYVLEDTRLPMLLGRSTASLERMIEEVFSPFIK
jgi:NAD(P)H dehydrogenase (quinone)